tara:strand:+ start:2645 stop:2839 length:195 start_codon:yes stop_codon:yes gene_type:complete
MTINKATNIEYEHVDLILNEASAYNLKLEVNDLAIKIINNNLGINIVEAYQMAYNEIIKKINHD